MLGRPRIFRDSIHGDIAYARGDFQALVEAILDTRMFQRLRHIRATYPSLIVPGVIGEDVLRELEAMQ